MLRPLPQDQIALTRWQLKRELQHPISKRYQQHELLGILPVSNPFVWRDKEPPPIGLRLGLIQFHWKQAMRAQKLLPLGGFLFEMFEFSLQLVFLFRMLPNLAFSLMAELIGIALQAPGDLVRVEGGVDNLTMAYELKAQIVVSNFERAVAAIAIREFDSEKMTDAVPCLLQFLRINSKSDPEIVAPHPPAVFAVLAASEGAAGLPFGPADHRRLCSRFA